MPDNLIDAQEFRRTLGNFCTGVAIVTGRVQGIPKGFTVQSLVSLSLSPPLVGFSPAKASQTWQEIRRTGQFCVNILADHQKHLCSTFARPTRDRFAGLDWRWCAAGLPVLDGVLAYISCGIENEHETGDHTFVVGRVKALQLMQSQARPLVYFRGAVGIPA